MRKGRGPTPDIAQRIRTIRLEKGLKASYVAESVGISKGFFCLIEQGKRSLSAERVRDIAEAMGLPVSTLIGESEDTGKTVPPASLPMDSIVSKKALREALQPQLEDDAEDAVSFLFSCLNKPEDVRERIRARVRKALRKKPKKNPSAKRRKA